MSDVLTGLSFNDTDIPPALYLQHVEWIVLQMQIKLNLCRCQRSDGNFCFDSYSSLANRNIYILKEYPRSLRNCILLRQEKSLLLKSLLVFVESIVTELSFFCLNILTIQGPLKLSVRYIDNICSIKLAPKNRITLELDNLLFFVVILEVTGGKYSKAFCLFFFLMVKCYLFFQCLCVSMRYNAFFQ